MKQRKTKAPEKPDQLALYERGIRAFREGDFHRAKALFEQASEGPNRGIAHRARLHVLMCDRRLEAASPVPQTAEEHYTYAVALMNARDLNAARPQLEKALQLDPKADHVYHTLAVCLTLSGDWQGAYQSLRRAIELRPQNRILARQDADLSAVTNRPPFDHLLRS